MKISSKTKPISVLELPFVLPLPDTALDFIVLHLNITKSNIDKMSKTLVKKALALVEEGLSVSVKKENNRDNKHQSNESDIMPQHHKMVRYVGKKGRKEAKDVLRRSTPMTVMEARKRIQSRKDNTEDNVRKLLLLSSADIGDEASAKLIKRAQTGRYVVKADEFLKNKKDSGKSVFDEEDFAKFEKELFCKVLNK